MKFHPTLLAAALTLALAACANDSDADNPPADPVAADTATTEPAAAPDAATAPGAPTGSLADHDRRALLAVQEVDRHEIAAAEDALAKNVQGDVRAYAETLRDDHGRNLEATRGLLGGVAGESGDGQHYAENGPNRDIAAGTADVQPAGAGQAAHTPEGDTASDSPELAAMRDKHEAERRRLSALEGDEFSREWIAAMVKGHEEALAKLDNELIPGAGDAAVAQHLQSTRAAISRHLDTGRSLQGAR